MNSKSFLKAAAVSVSAMTLSACVTNSVLEEPGDAEFGEANRQTMMAQVINPDPVYDEPMVTSAEHAQQAVERYRSDEVKQPESIQTTDVGEGNSGN